MKITWWIFSLSALWIYKQRTNFCEGRGPNERTNVEQSKETNETPGSNVSRCPQLSAPLNGSFQCCPNFSEGTCWFSCAKGYRLVGSATRTCRDNGTWSGAETQCNEQSKGTKKTLGSNVSRCPQLSAPFNGSLQCCSNFSGGTCRFSCDKGYSLVGSATRTCRDNGTWSGAETKCNAVICGPLIPPTNVTISPSSCLNSSTYNQTCTFSCQTSGYVLYGSSSRVCSDDGSWTGSNNTRCRPIEPTTTTVSPSTTTSGPDLTTEPPTTTASPSTTTSGPVSITEPPTTTASPSTTTSGPDLNTVCEGETKSNTEGRTLPYQLACGILAGVVISAIFIFIYKKKLRGPTRERPLLTSNQFTGVAIRDRRNHGNIHCEDKDSIAFHSSGFEKDRAGHNNLNDKEIIFNNSAALDVKYTAQFEGFFDSAGGVLNAAPNSDVQIIISNGALPDGDLQRIFFSVILEETGLFGLHDIPDEKTLISPVIECGPHDIKFLKPVEIIVPHCIYLKEVKERGISVYRTDPGSINWEKIPSESEKTDQSKAWFMVKPDSIHIKTMNFSLWSIFAYGGPKKKRATVFSSKPDCASDLIYLRFYVYNDNDDSRRQVEMKDEQRFCESKRSREKPFKLSNDNKWLTVKVTNIEEGWKLDKTNPEQIYHCNKPNGRGFRAVDAIDIIAKPKKGREVNGFSCKIMFQQDGDEEVHEIYVNPGFPPLKKLEALNSLRQNSKESNVPTVTAGSSTSSILKEVGRDNFGKESKQDSKLLSNLQYSGSFQERVCNRLDRRKKSGASGFHKVCSHYDIDEDKVAAVFEKYPAGPSRALLEYLAASHPELTAAEFASVLRKIAKRSDVAELLEEYDNQ